MRSSAGGLCVQTWLLRIAIAAAIGVAYFLAAQLSNSFLITPETVIFWPAAGISSGLLVALWSTARLPVLAGVAIATAAANLLRHFGIATTAAWVVGNTAEPLIIAGLVQYIDRLYCVLGLFAAAVAGTVAASTWWTFVYYCLFASLSDPVAIWLHWIVSDVAGIVSVAPLVIGVANALRRPPAWREAIESIAALVALAAMSGVIVSLPLGIWETVVPAALVFPILLWLAARSPPIFSAAGTFIVCMSVALTAIYGLGHFRDSSLSIDARVLQSEAIILVVAFGTAVLAALFAERRESEAVLARANAMLERERNSKLMNVEVTAAAIAHELRQPLAAIVANADASLGFLTKASPDLIQVKEALNDIIADGRRTSDAFDGIRALFRNVNERREQIDVNEICREVLRAMRIELNDHGITVVSELSPEMPPIQGNRGQLQQVIFNLAHNAVEAMGNTTGQPRVLRLITQREDRRRIVVRVQDTGPGIAPEQLEQIFNTFATTKPQGTGLGLAICRVIVDRHGGELSAFSDGKDGALLQSTFRSIRPTQPGDWHRSTGGDFFRRPFWHTAPMSHER